MEVPAFDPVVWATAEAERLRAVSNEPFHNSTAAGTRTTAGSIPAARSAQAEAAAAIEFLRRNAGERSELYRAAVDGLEGRYSSRYLIALAGLLGQFVAAKNSGMLASLDFEVASRVEAADDLMEQVSHLLSEKGVHVAAPVALAGAALEEMLRSMWIEAGEPKLPGKASISSYAAALQQAGRLSRGEVKDITAWADQRNDAAHGHFEGLDLQRARIMVDGINLFLQRRRPS